MTNAHKMRKYFNIQKKKKKKNDMLTFKIKMLKISHWHQHKHLFSIQNASMAITSLQY